MATDPADLLFEEYWQCEDPDRAKRLLETLAGEHALPGIREMVRRKLAFQEVIEAQEVEGVSCEALAELTGRLRARKAQPGAGSMGMLAEHMAAAARHACDRYLRRKRPHRHRIETRLRYLLTVEKNLAIWEGEGAEWMCGPAGWRSERRPAAPAERLDGWRETLSDVARGRSGQHPADLLALIFERFGGPIELDRLAGIVAWIWEPKDASAAPRAAAREPESGESDPGLRREMQRWLAAWWAQVRQLPAAERAALVFGLEAGGDGAAVALLPLAGVAGVREIAQALELPAEELAGLWNRLPLDDLAIAERLGVDRAQVIELRESARERLHRG